MLEVAGLIREHKRDFRMKKWFVVIGICVISFGYGCARTVVSPSKFLSMELTVRLRGNIDLGKYRYFVLMSSRQKPLVPIPLPQDYFPTPGSTYSIASLIALHPNGLIKDYYNQYFKTWSDYMVLTSSGVSLFKSYATGFPENVIDHLAYLPLVGFQPAKSEIVGKEWKLVIPMQVMSDASDTLRLNLAVSEVRDGTQSGYVMDTIRANFPIIKTEYGQQGEQADIEDIGLDGAADISSWRVRLF